MTATVFIDGAVGTTGLEIVERLAPRSEFTLLSLDEASRKSADARRDAYHAADFAVLVAFHCFYKVGSFYKTFMCTGIQPCESLTQKFYI